MAEVTPLDLQKPFEAKDIKWRVQQAGVSKKNGKPYVMAIPYVSNRAIQKRLDELFGVFGWENVFKATEDGAGYLCGITLHSGDKSVTKWDGANKTNIESLKGGLSGSMKRAAVQLGIGRYLYELDPVFARCDIITFQNEAENSHRDKTSGQLIGWETPGLPEWALPFEDYDHLIKPIREAVDMAALRTAFKEAYKAAEISKKQDLEQAAIAEKDKRKAYIQKNIDTINSKKEAGIEAWLDEQILVLAQLPNKSTVDNLVKLVTADLEVRAKGEGIAVPRLEAKLNDKYKARLTEIKKA